MNKKPLQIFIIAFLQLVVVFKIFYVFYVKLQLRSLPAINIVVTVFAVNLIITIILLLKLHSASRVTSIINLSQIAFFSLIGILEIKGLGIMDLLLLAGYIISSLYFIYYLTRQQTKELFRNL